MADSMFDATNVGVAKGRAGGYCLIAPANTDPTQFEDMTKTLAELQKTVSKSASAGYISEDGVTKTVDTDSEDFKDWAADTILSPITSYSESVSCTFLESRESVLKAVYGEDNVAVDSEKGVTTVRHNQDFNGAHVYVFDSVVSDTKVKRTIIPNGVITERDDVEENSSDLAGYTPTIKCLPSSFYDGDTMREFIYDTTVTPTV